MSILAYGGQVTLIGLLVVFAAAAAVFLAVFGTVIGVKMPVLSWTSEVTPIKQSGAVSVAIFSSWGIVMAFAGLYFLVGRFVGAGIYLGFFTVLFTGLSLLLLRWLDRKGAEIFSAL